MLKISSRHHISVYSSCIALNSTRRSALAQPGALWGVTPRANFPDAACPSHGELHMKRKGPENAQINSNELSSSSAQEQDNQGKFLRRSCDADFTGPGRGPAVIRNRNSGCGFRSRLLLLVVIVLLLLPFVPLGLLVGRASVHPRGKLQTGLRREGLLQNLEHSLDLQRREEVRSDGR